jgi:hypothetical protein
MSKAESWYDDALMMRCSQADVTRFIDDEFIDFMICRFSSTLLQTSHTFSLF